MSAGGEGLRSSPMAGGLIDPVDSLARVLAQVADGVFLVDPDGIVRLWNPAAETITGIDAGSALNEPVEDVLPGLVEAAAAVVVAGGPGAESRRQTVALDVWGRKLRLSVSGVHLADGIVYAVRDLTEEHRLETLKDDFIATVSHELRTPVASVYGAAMTLQRPDLGVSEAMRESLLSVIYQETDRLVRLVDDIIWAGRIEAETVTVDISPCDAVEIAWAALAAARVRREADPPVELVTAGSVPAVAADADKLRQVLVHLVENAVKHGSGRVEVRVEPLGGFVRFSVCDEGPGIPAAEHGRIFERFYRVGASSTRSAGGSGLGLYICKELVRLMDGRLSLSSREGEGAIFRVDLPAV